MKMIELSREKFEDFVNKTKYSNYCQSEQYGRAMKYDNFKYTYIAYTTNDYEILAAGMFLIKKINPVLSYAYCPKGFICDFENIDIIKKFAKNLIKYFRRRNIIFLKINPELPIATIDYKNNYERKILPTNNVLLELKKIGYMRRKETEPLELIEPKLTAIVNLKDYDYNNLSEYQKRKIEDNNNKGFEIELGDSTKIEKLTKIVNPNLFDYYKNLYDEFKKDNLIDLILLKINYEKFLITSKKKIEKEEVNNEELNKLLQNEPSEEILNKKMLSDKLLEEYKQEIVYATNGMKNKENSYIAAALIIKYNNKITLLFANSAPEYEHLEPNYYLYNSIFEKYKEEYEFADLNGIANDFTDNSKYSKLNNFKINFNPIVYEYIGELDVIINKMKYKFNENNVYYSRINKEKKDK